MAPLAVMLAGWAVFRLLGAAGVMPAADSWTAALRFALSVMFLFTAGSHFVPRTRADLVRMVPPALPNPAILVMATGVLELLGAIALLVPSTVKLSAYALIALLVAMFPANISAAQRQLTIAGRP